MKFKDGPYVIGLTGGIATGKSTISSILKKLGAHVIDADVISHELTSFGEVGLRLIKERFGSEVLEEDGTLNRRLLGQIVFSDKIALGDLNAIMHPLITQKAKDLISSLGEGKCVIFDAPLLFESGGDKLAHEIWVVWVEIETQIKRVMERDGLNREQALARIHSQMPLEEKIRRAQVIIDTGKSLRETKKEVTLLWDRVKRCGAEK